MSAKIKDLDLQARIRSLLCEMQMLGEAPAFKMEASVSQSKQEDRPPRGTFGRVEDLSMHETYVRRFAKATSSHDTLAILIEGEQELRDHKFGIDLDRLILQQTQDEQRDEKLLLEQGEGVHAAVICARYKWKLGWVRTVRERNGKDPDYGKERPRWRETPNEERYALCARLAAEGLTQTEGAKRLGIAQQTVSPYWPKRLDKRTRVR